MAKQEKRKKEYNQRYTIWRILQLLKPWRSRIVWSNIFGLLSSLLGLFSLVAIFPILELIFSPSIESDKTSFRENTEIIQDEHPIEESNKNKIQEWKGHFNDRKDQFFVYISEWSVQNPPRTLITVGILLLLFSFLRFISIFRSKLIITNVETDFLHKLTKQLYDHVINHEYAFFRRFPPGKLITRLSLDIYRMQRFIEIVYVSRVQYPFTFLSLLLMLFLINYKLAGIILLFIPLFIIPGIYLSRKVRSISSKELGLDTEYVELLEEQFTGFPIVKSFAAEPKESKRYYDQLNDIIKRRRSRQIMSAIGLPLQELLTTIIVILLVGLGYVLVFEYKIIAGNQLLFFLITTAAMFNPVKKILDFNVKLQRPLVSAGAILKVLDTPKSEINIDEGIDFPEDYNSVTFESIDFKYGSGENYPWIFKNFNLQLKSNEIVAVQGPNGSGKSTLALLLSGHYRPQRGEIKFNGNHITSIKLREIRKNITLIHQEAILFSLSIAENIAFGVPSDEIDYQRIQDITIRLGLSDFLNDMPDGIHTVLGIKENALSGGEKQIITLCRAFYFDCPILILDEPTNNLDQTKVLLLIEKLKALDKNKLVMIITHNPALINAADRLVVLQQGEIISDQKILKDSSV